VHQHSLDGSRDDDTKRRRSTGKVQLDGIDADLVGLVDVLSAVTDRLDDHTPGVLGVLSVKLAHAHYFGSRRPAARREQAALASASQARQVHWLGLLSDPSLTQLAARYTGRHWSPVAAHALLDRVMMLAEVRGLRVGFLGFKSKITEYQPFISRRWPDVDVAFTWVTSSATLRDNEKAEFLAERAREKRVHILVLNLPVPHQERFIAEHGYATGAQICVGLGPVSIDSLLSRGAHDRELTRTTSTSGRWRNGAHRLVRQLGWSAWTCLDLRRSRPVIKSAGRP
jgi:hypothetical protein